jgi:hypothetical protein
MKKTRLLRLLSLFGFLLLFAPFYDSCEGGGLRKVRETTFEGREIEIPLHLKFYDKIVDEQSFSGFEIASLFVSGMQEFESFDECKVEISKSFQQEDWYKNLGMLISLLFDFIVLISFSMAILVISKKIKYLNTLAVVNVILISITFLYIVFLESSFEKTSQIKWGYYAFIITNLMIFYYSKSEKHIQQ